MVSATPPPTPPAARVDAARYDAFWLWAGVRPQPALDRAEQIYLLHGAVVGGDTARLVAQRPAVPHVRHARLWMVVRVETLDWTPHVHAQLLAALDRWRRAGNRVVGVQIDFDARTRHLARYATFLRTLRAQLPAAYRLGITGLLDWSANGDPAGLCALAGVVDEVVLQIYQGRRVIPGYAAYLARLDRLTIPFRIGLLQGGEWSPPPGLSRHPLFRGYVVFLVNP
ncbi:DUF3142 domain-containing protein [uncultured Sphingomonas sp.]|uniref:DUF3142 domain-containing protein n=1 Tax=uncultured Sphingomonas sp. TaxID=158754 RepID=UPI00258D6F74|nr:DUF3142 domain-containing protein [uncultured Sphingomonas sp.]